MSKIVQAANAMISNPHLIERVRRGNHGEIFFLYKGKYKWSIRKSDGVVYLYYYPGQQSLDALVDFTDEEWQEFSEMVAYSSKEIGTREAISTFSDLYTVLKERLFGINEVLDDILSDNF